MSINVAGITAFYFPPIEGLLSSSANVITQERLYDTAIVFLIITALLVCATYIYLYLNKKAFFYKQRIRKQLDIWISKAILEELGEGNQEISIPSKFKRIVHHPIARQFVIDELVATKKGLTGAAASNIVQLYLQLDLRDGSIKKMDHKKWYVRARGIQELYVMEQSDMLLRIYRQTNSKNEFVRMEAQTGIVHLSGFKGLRFLDIVVYPITEWQQLKLLDQLSQVPFVQMKSLGKWLLSANPSVVLFALRIVETYQQFQVHDGVAACLHHELEPVRMQAVRTLASIAGDETADMLLEAFAKEKFTVKLCILDHLAVIATPLLLNPLYQLLDFPNDLIKLKAAKALASCSPEGMEALQKKAAMQPEPYQQIFLHVQSEIKA